MEESATKEETEHNGEIVHNKRSRISLNFERSFTSSLKISDFIELDDGEQAAALFNHALPSHKLAKLFIGRDY